MQRVGFVCVLITLLIICGSLLACTQNGTIEITISPHVLNLESSGGAFTIHTDIKYNPDVEVEVYLNNKMDSVTISSTFADSRGDLVIKCDILDVKEIVSEGSATVKLIV